MYMYHEANTYSGPILATLQVFRRHHHHHHHAYVIKTNIGLLEYQHENNKSFLFHFAT